ncbi:unnamed protein product [Leptosia nina]|uniref:Uncharacterized protein n=1 Tax=Leptosia nina TaxID=320188 RepID=A0AAV1IXL4_9NEOP
MCTTRIVGIGEEKVSPSSKQCYKPCLIARSKSNRDYVAASSIPHNDATTAGDIGSLALSSDVVASSFEELKDQILSLRTIIIDFKSETYSQLTRAIASFTSRLDNMEFRISKLEESVLQLGANNQHSCEVELLKRRLNQSEQQCLMNDVEIAGVFEANGENTEHVAILLAQILELFERLVYKKRIAYVKDLFVNYFVRQYGK